MYGERQLDENLSLEEVVPDVRLFHYCIWTIRFFFFIKSVLFYLIKINIVWN